MKTNSTILARCLAVFCFLCITAKVSAQVKFGDNKSTINGGSLLELESTTSPYKGLLLPRISLSSTTSWGLGGSGAAGMVVYNSNVSITGSTAYPVLPGGIGFYSFDGTGWVGAAQASAITGKFWGLTGNAGTVDGTNFLGTTDNIPLTFRVNNTMAGRLDGTNAFLGYQAGGTGTVANILGSGNVLLGYQAGYNTEAATRLGSYSSYNVIQGYQSGYGRTDVVSQYNIIMGYQASYGYAGANDNIIMGRQAAYNTTSAGGFSNNIIMGYQAAYNLGNGGGAPANGIALGNQAAYNMGNGGNGPSDFIYLGRQAGFSNTGASYDIAIGNQAGYTNTGAPGNIFVGRKAGYFTTGGSNTIIGYQAGSGSASNGGASNTLIGYQAGTANSGSNNALVGYNAGSSNTTGSGNTFIGYSAGSTNTTGSTNIVIGSGQNAASATGSNQLNIGGAIFGTGLTGTAVSPAGSIGINTNTPSATLHINGNEILGTATSTSGGTGYSTVVRDNTTGELKVAVSSTGNTAPFNYITYSLSNVNGDWVSDYDTKIKTSDYTIAVIGSTFDIGSNGLSANGGGTFDPLNVYAFQSGSTWHLSADYKNAGTSNGGNGTWTLYCLVINNSVVKSLGTVTQNLGGSNTGAAASAPAGL